MTPPAARQLQFVFADLKMIFIEAHRQLKPRTPVPQFHLEFFPFAGLNHTARLRDGLIRVRLSDIFTDAPPEIIGSLATILLAKLYRRNIDSSVHYVYRAYILRADIQERARVARSERGRTFGTIGSRGRHVDLATALGRVNARYFDGEMKNAKISWSAKRSRYILGRYDALHDTIFISRIFDSAAVPEFVIDYIVFHEMLHVKHRAYVEDARCIVHSREFRTDERQFAEYNAAKHWLKTL
jgi:hypothetical protein